MEEQKATKVTLYLPPDLHRQLKIRSAVEGEAMSSIAKRAIDFYLANSDLVEEDLGTVHGHAHRIYDCPSCATPVVVHQGELVEIARMATSDKTTVSALDHAEISEIMAHPGALGEGELVVC